MAVEMREMLVTMRMSLPPSQQSVLARQETAKKARLVVRESKMAHGHMHRIALLDRIVRHMIANHDTRFTQRHILDVAQGQYTKEDSLHLSTAWLTEWRNENGDILTAAQKALLPD